MTSRYSVQPFVWFRTFLTSVSGIPRISDTSLTPWYAFQSCQSHSADSLFPQLLESIYAVDYYGLYFSSMWLFRKCRPNSKEFSKTSWSSEHSYFPCPSLLSDMLNALQTQYIKIFPSHCIAHLHNNLSMIFVHMRNLQEPTQDRFRGTDSPYTGITSQLILWMHHNNTHITGISLLLLPMVALSLQ